MSMLSKPRSDMTAEELATLEEEEFTNGPLSVLTHAVNNKSRVLISLRNNIKLLARIRAFDRHMNMVLEDVIEMTQQEPTLPEGNGRRSRAVNVDRYIAKMLLRGDSVILVMKNPNPPAT